MISSKLKHSSDRCLLTISSIIQTVLWIATAVIAWINVSNTKTSVSNGQIYNVSLCTLFAAAWIVFCFLVVVSLFKSGGPSCGMICLGLFFVENTVALVPIVILGIGSIFVFVVHLIVFLSYDSVEGVDVEILSIVSIIVYIGLFVFISLSLIVRAAFKHMGVKL